MQYTWYNPLCWVYLYPERDMYSVLAMHIWMPWCIDLPFLQLHIYTHTTNANNCSCMHVQQSWICILLCSCIIFSAIFPHFLKMEPKVGSEMGHTNKEISKCDAWIVDLQFSVYFQLYSFIAHVICCILFKYVYIKCEKSSCNKKLCEGNAGIHHKSCWKCWTVQIICENFIAHYQL